MKIGITYRLFFAILTATALAVLALFLVAGWSIDRGFYRYLAEMDHTRLEQLALELGRRYEENNGWDFPKRGAPGTRFGWDIRPRPPDADPEPEAGGETPPLRPPDADRTVSGPKAGRKIDRSLRPPGFLPPDAVRANDPLVVLDADKKVIVGRAEGEGVVYRPITVRGETVGYVGLRSPRHFLHPGQVEFLARQRLYLALAAAGMIIVAIIISFPLARRLIKPLREMAEATRAIASGRYATRVAAVSSDELGQLARSFNAMALTLEKNEKVRRQWVADISHELRTPVSILQGEIEALQDGVRAVTPDSIRSLHVETLRLKRLINDLYQLSLSDIGALAYRKENIDIIGVLNDVLATCQDRFEKKGIAITQRVPHDENATVFADRERAGQLFMNILDNSLSYTDSGGELHVDVAFSGSACVIEFQDSAPGVPGEALPKLFERFYRVEVSRNRQSGGAGLGLAICRNIVEAHEGAISAHPSLLGGLSLRVTLPLSGELA